MAELVTAAFEGFFDDDGDADEGGAGVGDDAGEGVDGAAGGEEVVDDEHAMARAQELGGDHEEDFAALGVAGGSVDVDGFFHGDGLVLARVEGGEVVERAAGHDGGDDAAYFGGEDERGIGVAKAAGDLLADGFHEVCVYLVVEEAVDFEDAAAEVLTFVEDAFSEDFHGVRSPMCGGALDRQFSEFLRFVQVVGSARADWWICTE